MIPTDVDVNAIRQSIEAASGLDDELRRRCAPLIHMGAFDEAVRNAFVLLEERLRQATGNDGLTGVQLANNAFAAEGRLTKHLGQTPAEREGLRELYSGAFKLFRNPAAHNVVGYSDAQGKSIIGLVNLLLEILARAGELPPPALFPPNVDAALSDAEKALGAGAADRLRTFLGRCIMLGLRPGLRSKQWLPFRRHALVQYGHWPEARPFRLTVLYLTRGNEIGLLFPINQYYSNVKGLNLRPLHQSLKGLGFTPTGKHRDPYIVLNAKHNQAFFDRLLEFTATLNSELEASLQGS
jgi:uncharacterized protein (TIGR02391 family)